MVVPTQADKAPGLGGGGREGQRLSAVAGVRRRGRSDQRRAGTGARRPIGAAPSEEPGGELRVGGGSQAAGRRGQRAGPGAGSCGAGSPLGDLLTSAVSPRARKPHFGAAATHPAPGGRAGGRGRAPGAGRGSTAAIALQRGGYRPASPAAEGAAGASSPAGAGATEARQRRRRARRRLRVLEPQAPASSEPGPRTELKTRGNHGQIRTPKQGWGVQIQASGDPCDLFHSEPTLRPCQHPQGL
ncbi:translation initiation factor IF-2-like [Cervus canadensis]|uniref:translation initiation factor IF-2-like n=1 Tax=Cervus canadensis TaxID=1574408 RepID=UPI001C9E8B36|nr:translation initiation factor IF-2-like [Cervus canadensis]